MEKSQIIFGGDAMATVCITCFFPDNRRHDPDNYAGKLLLDGLKKAGIIKDDDFKHQRQQLL